MRSWCSFFLWFAKGAPSGAPFAFPVADIDVY